MLRKVLYNNVSKTDKKITSVINMENIKIKSSIKERNKERVVKCALESFIEFGIEKTKVSDIAKKAELTERSVFRYFDAKSDLVFEAVLLFWENVKNKVTLKYRQKIGEEISGIEQVKEVLKAYSEICFTNRQEFVFLHEAESYLYRVGKSELIENKYILSNKTSSNPLEIAIGNGIKDKSIRQDIDLAMLYYNTFDSLLGLIQKIAVSGRTNEEYVEIARKRLNNFCELTVKAYCSK